MGWVERREPTPAPVGTTGTTRAIEEAFSALAAVGIVAPTLAEAARKAADVIRDQRGAVGRHVRQEDTASGSRAR